MKQSFNDEKLKEIIVTNDWMTNNITFGKIDNDGEFRMYRSYDLNNKSDAENLVQFFMELVDKEYTLVFTDYLKAQNFKYKAISLFATQDDDLYEEN